MKKHIIALAALGLPLAAMAQTVKVDFEDASGYKSVGVYDTWEESPFRLGTLKGNCAVVDNFISPTNELGEVVNDSKKILGVQRSRFGSNTFGARIDLNTPFDITPTYKYVHVKIYKPVKGRVMLVALGKRLTCATPCTRYAPPTPQSTQSGHTLCTVSRRLGTS